MKYDKIKHIKLENWIIIGMILGSATGLFLNFFVDDVFIKNIILMDNIFYFGGELFFKLIKMIIVPLVFCSIVISITSLDSLENIGKIGGYTLLFYIMTSLIAVLLSIFLAMYLEPGIGLDLSSISQTSNTTVNQTMTETILNMIPENPFASLASGNLIELIIFAVLIGIILTKLQDETDLIRKFFNQANNVMIEMTSMIMKFAPIGIFCLTARTFGALGFDALLPLGKYIFGCILCLAIHFFIVYPIMLVLFTRLNPIRFFKKFISTILFAFSSSSSSATIPLNVKTLSEMGVSEKISSFTIPFGATINMDGGSIVFAFAVIFISQALGMNIGFSLLITIIVTVLLASIGTAAVPSGAIATFTMVFEGAGLPLSTLAIVLAPIQILDMFVTAVNVTGDAVCTLIIAFKNKALDVDVFNGKKSFKKEDI